MKKLLLLLLLGPLLVRAQAPVGTTYRTTTHAGWYKKIDPNLPYEQFPDLAPPFTVPFGKLFGFMGTRRADATQKMLVRGVNVLNRTGDSRTLTETYYDDWIGQITGCRGGCQQNVDWVNANTPEHVAQTYTNSVRNQRNVRHLMDNNEWHTGSGVKDDQFYYRRYLMYKRYKETEQSSDQVHHLWGERSYEYNNGAGDAGVRLAHANLYTMTREQIFAAGTGLSRMTRDCDPYTPGVQSGFDYLDGLDVYGYHTGPNARRANNTLQMLEIQRKLFPTKYLIMTQMNYLEMSVPGSTWGHTLDFYLGYYLKRRGNGFHVNNQSTEGPDGFLNNPRPGVKGPRIDPTTVYNQAVLALFLGDGWIKWDVAGLSTHGDSTNNFVSTDPNIPTSEVYYIAKIKDTQMDEAALAAYYAHLAKPFLEAATPWEIPDRWSIDGGATWITGIDRTPVMCQHNQHPSVRLKMGTGSTGIVIAFNENLQNGARQAILVEHRGKQFTQYAGDRVVITEWANLTPYPATQTVPTSPTSAYLMSYSLAAGRADLGWTPGQGQTVQAVELRRQEAGGAMTPWVVVGNALSATQFKFVLTGLNANVRYEARVQATNGLGSSDYSNVVSFTLSTNTTPTPPGAITNLIARNPVTWTPPPGVIDRYEVERINPDASITPLTTAHPGSATSYAVSYPQNNTWYRFRFRACNSAGCGPWATTPNMMFIDQDNPTSAPDQPTNITVVYASPTTANINYVAPTGSVSGFGFEIRRAGTNEAWRTLGGQPGTSTRGTADYLSVGTNYEVRMRACNSAGCSAWTEPVGYTHTAQTTGAPAAPTNVDGVYLTPTSAQFSWRAPAGTITGYALFTREVGQAQFTNRGGQSGTTTTWVMPDVVGGRSYEFQLYACNTSGCGDFSQTFTYHHPVVSNGIFSATNLRGSWPNPPAASMRLDWIPGSSHTSQTILVERSTGPGWEQVIESTVGASQNTATFPGVLGNVYRFRIRSQNATHNVTSGYSPTFTLAGD